MKRPSLFRVIYDAVREVLRSNRRQSDLARARERLRLGEPEPMQQLARGSLGDAWVALAEFYADLRPDAPALATDAYCQALQCREWLSRPARLEDIYDRRRFLGIGTAQDLAALAGEWKRAHFPGYGRETELVWIHACGPAVLRDLQEAWWWVAVAQARWGGCREVELPIGSVTELREQLVKALPGTVRRRLLEKAKDQAYAEFVSGK